MTGPANCAAIARFELSSLPAKNETLKAAMTTSGLGTMRLRWADGCRPTRRTLV